MTLGTPAGVSSIFADFGTGDRIDLTSVQGTSLSYDSGTLSVLGANDATVATLIFAGSHILSDFALQADGSNTDILYSGSLADFARHALGADTDLRFSEKIPAAFGGDHWAALSDILSHVWPLRH